MDNMTVRHDADRGQSLDTRCHICKKKGEEGPSACAFACVHVPKARICACMFMHTTTTSKQEQGDVKQASRRRLGAAHNCFPFFPPLSCSCTHTKTNAQRDQRRPCVQGERTSSTGRGGLTFASSWTSS
jgi:hypothetical protein